MNALEFEIGEDLDYTKSGVDFENPGGVSTC
jgi:hypothetical protein